MNARREIANIVNHAIHKEEITLIILNRANLASSGTQARAKLIVDKKIDIKKYFFIKKV